MPREWDAARYDRVALPQASWGEAVVERLDPHGIRRVLDAGCGSGRVTEQCGGADNTAELAAVLAELDPSVPPTVFETTEAAARCLRAAGFTEVETWLEDQPTPFPDRAALEEFLRAVLGSYLERRPEREREVFVRAVSDRLPEPRLDFVRLNILARRPGGASPPGDG